MEKTEKEIKKEEVEKKIKGFIEIILSKEDPDVLNTYKKLFKKFTPISKRGYLSAYLLKQVCDNTFTQKNYKRREPDPNKTTLYISIGKNRNVYPKDLARLFQSRLDLAPSDIGNIKVMESYSFMDIANFHVKRAIEMLDGEEFKGRRLTVNHAKTRDKKRNKSQIKTED